MTGNESVLSCDMEYAEHCSEWQQTPYMGEKIQTTKTENKKNKKENNYGTYINDNNSNENCLETRAATMIAVHKQQQRQQ